MTGPEASSIQSQFLSKIDDLIPPGSSMVVELSDLLEISTDSAYRRMRGETLLSIDEIIRLCDHFRISFDAFSRKESGLVTFRYSNIEPKSESFIQYLQSLKDDLTLISKSKDSQIIYACEDIPVFHHYGFDQIADFKMYYWMRSIMNVPELDNSFFDPSVLPSELRALSKDIIRLYSTIPSIEIWSETTIQSTLKQIEFYYESGMFKNREDALAVCDSLRTEISAIQKMAENSRKFTGEQAAETTATKNYELYFSDIELTNNCVLVKMEKARAVYLGHFSFYTMATMNETYCDKTEHWLNSIIKKSTLISGVSEKQRYQFFRKAYKMLDDLELRIKES